MLCFGLNGISQNMATQEWTENSGSQNSLKPPKITLDDSQNSILTGVNYSTTEGENITTTKVDPNGTLLWEQEYNVGSNDKGIKSVIDQNNNIYTLGKVETLSGFRTIVLKYSPTGSLLWQYTLTAGDINIPNDIFIGSNGSIYFTAEYEVSSILNVFVGQLNNIGVLQNQYNYTTGDNHLLSLHERSGKLLIGSNTNGINHSYLTQLNSNLTQEWRINVDDELVYSTYDASGNIVYATLNATQNNQGHLYKIQNNTTAIWDVNLGFDCKFNAKETIKIDGNFTYVMSLHNSDSEVTLRKVNNTGNIEWSKPYYGNGTDFSNPCFALSNNSVICLTNEINGQINYVLTYKIGQDGNLQWRHKKAGKYAGGIELNSDGEVLIASQKENNILYQTDLTKLSQYYAQEIADVSLVASGNLAYFQYVNQIKKMDGSTIKDLAYYGYDNDDGYYLFNDKISFTHFVGDQDTVTLDTLKRWDFKFMGANVVEPTGLVNVDYFNNYYYTGLKRERINGYKTVVYPSLYEHIDLVIGENRHGMVLNFVNHNGANANNINLSLMGGEHSIDGVGNLHTTIDGFEQIFERPTCYQIDTVLLDTTLINCMYVLTANTLSFNMANPINNTNTIRVIQLKEKGPTLQTKSPTDNFNWCSYIRNPGQQSFGASIFKIDHDANNNTYYVGTVYDNSFDGSFPTSSGVFPFSIGEYDITIMKLNDNVEIQWSTYFGGTGTDDATGVAVNDLGTEIYAVGFSSSTDFPTSSVNAAAYQSASLGTSFLLELDQNGQTLWSTKFELSGANSGTGFRDCELIGGSLYAVGSRAGLSPSTMPNDIFYHSLNGTGFLGIFKNGIYMHGTAFGSSVASTANTNIYGIDYNGVDAIAITGETVDQNLPIVNAPVGYDFYSSGNPDLTNAFVAKMNLSGNLDFSYYINSFSNVTATASQLQYGNVYYTSNGDRGNDVSFTPDGTSIYFVGEVYGGDFTHHASANPLAYNQPNRSLISLSNGGLSNAGFIFKTDANGGIQSANYFSPSATDDAHLTSSRLQEIAFDSNDNLYITGSQGITYCDATATPNAYNIPTPNTQPVGFYQKMKTTNSGLTGAFKINANSFIIGFNANDEYIWSTYVSGYKPSMIKPLTITNNNHLYFGGSSDVINQLIDNDFPNATDAEKDVIKLPYWELDDTFGSIDWFNGQGAGNTCEFAGRFDVSGVNMAGPLVGVGIKENSSLQFSVYPNPNQTDVLHIEANGLNKLEIYSLDGKLVVTLTKNNLKSVNISHLAKGVYVVKGYDKVTVYSTKFIKQ